MSVIKDRQKLIRLYKDQTGKDAVDMHEVADWALARGYLKAPEPQSPRDIVARRLSKAARQERRVDEANGRKVRAWHAVQLNKVTGPLTLWYDIDDVPRGAMHLSATQRREGIINDAVQLSLDLDYWNRKHPEEDPIRVGFDFDDEVEWEKHARDAEQEAAEDADPPPVH